MKQRRLVREAIQRAEQLTGGGKKVSVYDVQPQIWLYEKANYRSFVCIPGHKYENFSRPNLRAILLRGMVLANADAEVAWTLTSDRRR